MKRYIRASFINEIPEWLRSNNGALDALNRVGYDLHSMQVSDTPSGRGKDAVVYLVKYGNGSRSAVVIPGLYNEDDIYLSNPATGNYEKIKYVPKKYWDITDQIYINKLNNRKALKDRYKDPRYIYDPAYNESYYGGQYKYKDSLGDTKWSKSGRGNRYTAMRDKSGYVIPDPEAKLKAFYASGAGSTKLRNRLDALYATLTDLKTKLFDIDFTSFGAYDDGEFDNTAYRNILSRFGDACYNYNQALQYLSESRDSSKWAIKQAVDDIKSAEESAKRVERSINTGRYDW